MNTVTRDFPNTHHAHSKHSHNRRLQYMDACVPFEAKLKKYQHKEVDTS